MTGSSRSHVSRARRLSIWRRAVFALFLGIGAGASAQEGRPSPQPAPPATEIPAPPEPVVVTGASLPATMPGGRRENHDDKVVLALNDVAVDQLIPFIVEITGKVVMPINVATLKAKKITLINDEPIDKMYALDLITEAFKLNDVGIIERDDQIVIGLLSEISKYDPVVVGPGEDIMNRTDRGIMIQKIYAVKNTDAEALSEQLTDSLPDHATMVVDANSNQIIVIGTVGLCQRVGKLIEELDRNYMQVKTQTFRLAHADASEVAQNILDLFEEPIQTARAGGQTRSQQPSTRGATAEQRRRARQAGQPVPATPGGEASVGPTVEMRITVSVQQNSVTVSGEPAMVDEVARLIIDEWDLPRPETTKKVYQLTYVDPVKMRDMLHELLGTGGGGGGGGARRAGTRTAGQPGGGGGGAGGRSDVTEAIGGIYQIQAYPDSNSLVVICKTEESFVFLDSLIADLDRPLIPGLPLVVELKHADAEEVADQINAIFAPAGARVDLARRDTGLEGINIEGPSGGTSGGTSAAGPARQGEAGQTITFPWQQGQQREDETPESPLIGKVRVVPIHRQNAVMILAAPEYRNAVRDIILQDLDKPGRQVLIAAVIVEVELTDELALGLRISNSNSILSGTPVDNRLGGTAVFAGQNTDFLGGLFNTSTLDVGMTVNAVIQLLDQKTKIRVLQDPAVFTADNQEASFFEGQDVPVLTASQLTPQGGVTESVDYQAVGIGLNVRPRITVHGDVDMEINLEISNIDAAASAAFSDISPVFDRRETTTEVIVKDGQTIVISGILRSQESKIKRKVPLLGDIPLLGWAFQSTDDQTSRIELLAFITPYVVDSPDMNDVNFNEEARKRLQELSRPLKEQNPEAIDPAKIRRRLLNEPLEDLQSGEP